MTGKNGEWLLLFWAPALVAVIMAALEHLIIAASITAIAGVFRAQYPFSGMMDLLEVIPGWKFITAFYLLAAAGIMLFRPGDPLIENDVLAALAVMAPLLISSITYDYKIHQGKI